jgi:hypothetical protein
MTTWAPPSRRHCTGASILTTWISGSPTLRMRAAVHRGPYLGWGLDGPQWAGDREGGPRECQRSSGSRRNDCAFLAAAPLISA